MFNRGDKVIYHRTNGGVLISKHQAEVLKDGCGDKLVIIQLLGGKKTRVAPENLELLKRSEERRSNNGAYKLREKTKRPLVSFTLASKIKEIGIAKVARWFNLNYGTLQKIVNQDSRVDWDLPWVHEIANQEGIEDRFDA